MNIDSPATVLVALAVALGATVLLAGIWDARRLVGRILLVTAVVLTVSSTAVLELNRLTETYPTWTSLLSRSTEADHVGDGDQPPADDEQAPPDEPEKEAPPVPVASGAPATPGAGGGRLVRYRVVGTASGLSMPMAVYLPGAYSTPAGKKLRFPVIEALHGYPGTPETWLRRLDVKRILDQEIAAGRMAPTVVLFPYQTPNRLLDTECTDLSRGPKAETYVTVDVPRWARTNLRVRTDGAGWGLIGYSAGAFCAMNLALRHPDKYVAGASLSGFSDPGIKVGDGTEKTTNNIAWQLTNKPPPPVSLFLGFADDDKGSRNSSRHIAQLVKPPTTVTTAHVPRGGHSHAVWREMEGPAFDWLSARLARAEPIPRAGGKPPRPANGAGAKTVLPAAGKPRPGHGAGGKPTPPPKGKSPRPGHSAGAGRSASIPAGR